MFNFKTLEIMNLENLNLVELNAQEKQEIVGGMSFWKALLGFAVSLLLGFAVTGGDMKF
ncbi:MAG: hypothetical protein RL308_1832 [Bacteroidota bacterium]|jgi:hypothetical protein